MTKRGSSEKMCVSIKTIFQEQDRTSIACLCEILQTLFLIDAVQLARQMRVAIPQVHSSQMGLCPGLWLAREPEGWTKLLEGHGKPIGSPNQQTKLGRSLDGDDGAVAAGAAATSRALCGLWARL